MQPSSGVHSHRVLSAANHQQEAVAPTLAAAPHIQASCLLTSQLLWTITSPFPPPQVHKAVRNCFLWPSAPRIGSAIDRMDLPPEERDAFNVWMARRTDTGAAIALLLAYITAFMLLLIIPSKDFLGGFNAALTGLVNREYPTYYSMLAAVQGDRQ